jgi:hypothetical protein
MLTTKRVKSEQQILLEAELSGDMTGNGLAEPVGLVGIGAEDESEPIGAVVPAVWRCPADRRTP